MADSPRALVLVPVLDRPHRVEPLLQSLAGSLRPGEEAEALFLVTLGDHSESEAIGRAGGRQSVVDWEAGDGDYARKINLGFKIGVEEGWPWMFLGADDLHFHPGWLGRALQVARHRQGICVLGTNDRGNPSVRSGRHSTHSLVHADYLECGTVDEEGKILHEGYCNPPEAPIWMADLSFQPLGDVRTGDRVIGWERVPAGRFTLNRLRESEVIDAGSRIAPLVAVRMESGRLIHCTPNHNWLNARWSPASRHPREWVTPTVGRTLLHVAEQPSKVNGDARLAGWLGGIYDGEGSGVYLALQDTNHNPGVVSEIERALSVLEIPYRRSDRPSGVAEFYLNDGRQGYLAFLLKTQPVKQERLRAKILGGRRFGTRDRIVSVEDAGEGEVRWLTTETGNYVAWGYASKNSHNFVDNEFVQTAIARGTFLFARGSVVEHLHPHWNKGEYDATYRKGLAGFARDRDYFNERRRLWGSRRR